jgi:hypothetical protein
MGLHVVDAGENLTGNGTLLAQVENTGDAAHD